MFSFQNILTLTFTYCCIQCGSTPLAVALQEGHTPVVQLMQGHVTKDDDLLPILHLAAMIGDNKYVANLLNNEQTKTDFQIKVGYFGLLKYYLYKSL